MDVAWNKEKTHTEHWLGIWSVLNMLGSFCGTSSDQGSPASISARQLIVILSYMAAPPFPMLRGKLGAFSDWAAIISLLDYFPASSVTCLPASLQGMGKGAASDPPNMRVSSCHSCTRSLQVVPTSLRKRQHPCSGLRDPAPTELSLSLLKLSPSLIPLQPLWSPCSSPDTSSSPLSWNLWSSYLPWEVLPWFPLSYLPHLLQILWTHITLITLFGKLPLPTTCMLRLWQPVLCLFSTALLPSSILYNLSIRLTVYCLSPSVGM